MFCCYVHGAIPKKYKIYILILFSFLVIFSTSQNVLFSSAMITSKQAASQYLKKIPSNFKTLYLLGEKDPHIYAYIYSQGFIPYYLHSTRFRTQEVGVEEFADILRKQENVALIVGPHGKNSGRSILFRSNLPDYPFDEEEFLKSISKPFSARITLPYFAYFPSFIMEEELSQALYFSGRTPDYRDPSKNLTLYLWMK